MSTSLFSNDSENIESFHTRCDEESDVTSSELTIVEQRYSLVSTFYRLCHRSNEFFWSQIGRLLTFTFFTMLNIVQRLKHFSQAIRAPPSSSSSRRRTLEDQISCYSPSSQLHCESESSAMTHLLVHPSVHRSENIRIHSNKSSSNDSRLPMVHSVDETLFFSKQDSKDILQFLQRITLEPQISSAPSTCCFSLSTPSDEQTHIDLNCDQIEPVTSNDEITSDKVDVICASEISTDDVEGDVLLDSNVSNNQSLNNVERHFRRRKRRSSWTRLSNSIDDTQPIDINNNHSEIKEEPSPIQPVSLESLSTTIDGYRSRRLRQRFYRRQSTSNVPSSVEFFVPTDPCPSSAVTTPPPSPSSPIRSSTTSGRLKRIGSLGTTTKKMVRFADSIGQELAQVQYIHSITDEEMFTPKQILYGSKYTDFEPKPWSFDVALNSRPLTDQQKAKRFFVLYRQPNSEHPDIYLHDVWKNQIKLEHADIRPKSAGESSLSGTLWVTNASYFKYVTVKYTFNQWMNSYECETQHRCHSNDFRNIDQFEFNIDIPRDVDRIDFVLRYCVNGQEHWDNNDGKNYTLQSEATSTPQTTISLPHDCDFNEMRFY